VPEGSDPYGTLGWVGLWYDGRMSFQTDLLRWFEGHARPLPWRKSYRPYEVWVSEVMLQQTQVETMLPYFERWMKAFPNIKSLAGAPEKKVLKLWQGLGYYSRARNIHANAKKIVQQHGGALPRDFDTLLSLKGIGRYTAGAIASIAFNLPRPIVDGNVLRVLSRVYAIDKAIDVEKNRAVFWELETTLIPAGRARDFNQALMELGALVCTPRDPDCAVCPIKKHCAALDQNKVAAYPIRNGRKKTVKVIAAAAILRHRDKFLVHKRPLGQIMGGLWEFPEWKLARDKSFSALEIKRKTQDLLRSEFGLAAEGLRHLGSVRRHYTHHAEKLEVFSLDVDPAPQADKRDWPARWISPDEFRTYPFSSAHAKITRLVARVGAPYKPGSFLSSSPA